MGERHAGPDPAPGAPATGLEELLAAALRPAGAAAGPGADDESRAVAAFRDARDTGAHRDGRTRRRDDWRPEGER
ncbi:hypothetical protein [Streptomyces sp. CRN 30]|uniref:hypothetical protein n=1 Tax=Streptomyces sp. CRN 30 TaxID=3075613 RepID=UPI002A816113|nr:hypothetical protein [Streptomyces sp. CRN 30]